MRGIIPQSNIIKLHEPSVNHRNRQVASQASSRVTSTKHYPHTRGNDDMQHIDIDNITTSLPSRIQYLQSFLEFHSNEDGVLIQACKPVITSKVQEIVNQVYTHLLSYDITAKQFAPAQAPGQKSVTTSDLHLDHPNIKHRQEFLKAYLVRIVSNTDWSPSSKFWTYLNNVGRIHTGVERKGKLALQVEYREVSALLGWVEIACIDIVMATELDINTKHNVLKALSKLWWIQNDLFARHYIEVPIENRFADWRLYGLAGFTIALLLESIWTRLGLRLIL